jgi:ribosomal 50S subunit-recycling heat shock protein
MQGQDFQVHGMPDEIFNIVSSPDVQVNARFTYLESAACHDNYTACFAHPGTYITEQGFRVGADKMRVTAGSYKKGLTVHVNGKKIAADMELKSGASVQIVNHRRAIVTTPNVRMIITNSDKFMNQEMQMLDMKLIGLGAKRTVLKDNERFHPEVPMHGLQGQTWRNVEYPSGLEYEGSIMDYHVVSGNIYGTDFVFNHFKAQ